MLLNRFAETRISLEAVRNLVLLGVGVGALVPLPHHAFARVFRSLGCVIIGVVAMLLMSYLALSIWLRWSTTPTTRPTSTISSQAAQASAASAEQIVRVTAQSLNVRAQPTVNSDKVGLVHAGMELDVLDETYDASDKRWLRVRQRASGFDEAVEGWVNASFVEPVP
jgi:hypothetical protein